MVKRALDRVRRFGRRLKDLFWRRKIAEVAYFSITVGLTGFVLARTLPLWLAALIFAVVVIHEMGHYISAWRAGRDVWLPFFVPLFWAAHGGTYVGGEDPETDVRIALAGPTAGLSVTLLALAVFIGFRFMPGVWASVYMLVFQLFSGTIGSDGRKWRRAKVAVGQAQLRTRPVAAFSL